ncbi:MAG: hypothetical protein RIQ78_448 [Bacteroidota bacterium]|jgi:hypothetical protein
MRLNTFSVVTALGIVFTLFTSSRKNPNNPPAGNTGAPGETTCGQSGCHSGGVYTGTVTLTGVPDTAIFGQTYPITVHNTSNAVRAGFQLTCLDSIHTKCGSISTASGINVTSFSSRQYARQSQPKNLSGGTTSWTFNWTAPVTCSGNEATFYFVSLCSNSNGQKTGDNVLVSMKPIVLTQTSPTVEPFLSRDVKVFPTEVSGILNVDLLREMKGSLLLYNTAGQLMLEKELQQSNTLDLSALKTGAYVVKIQTASGSVVKKIVKY